MNLQEGDWVRTETGEIGKIVHIHRLSAFVDLHAESNVHDVKAFLLSALTKTEPPKQENTPKK